MPAKFFQSKREMIWLNAATLLFVAITYFSQPSILHSLDYVLFYKPNFQFLIDSFRDGSLPLWNPYIGLGRPFLADVQNAVFYPPLYVILPFGKEAGLVVLVYLHCLLAVCGMLLFSRRLQIGKTEGYLIAFSYLAGAALTGRFFAGQIFYCFAACYLPLLFFYSLKIEESFCAKTVGIYASLLVLQFLCGHPQIFWISTLGQAVFLFCRRISSSVGQSVRGGLSDLSKFSLCLLWAAGLAALALLPFLELVRYGNRSAPSLEFSNYGRMEWMDFLGFLVGPQSNSNLSWESNYYFGLMLLFPGLAGLFRFKDRDSRALLGIAVVSVLIAVGGNTPLFGWLYRYLPGIESFRLHARVLILLVFALLVAAGIWLTKQTPRSHDLVFLLIGSAVLIVFTAQFLFTKRNGENVFQASNLQAAILFWGSFLFTGLLAILKRAQSKLLRLSIGALVMGQLLDLATANLKLKVQYSFFAVLNSSDEFPYQQAVVEALNQACLLGPAKPPPRVSIPPSIVPVNYGMIHGYSHFDAYTSLFLRRPWEFLHQNLPVPANKNTSVARAVYDRGPFPYDGLGLVAGWDKTNRRVLLRTNSEPRAFLVYPIKQSPQEKLARREPKDISGIDETALFEPPISLVPNPQATESEATVKFVHFTPNDILLDVDSTENALLVLSEAWYPGWYASVGERTDSSVVANSWMRAFPLPAGQHRVRVFFRQNYLWAGAIITLISAGLLLVVLGNRRNFSRESSGARSTLLPKPLHRCVGH